MKAVFLDRDGTVIVDPPDERVDSLDKLALLPNSLEALRRLANLDYLVFMVSNQAGIAEGRLSLDEFWRLQDVILERLAPSGVKVSKTYVCPHAEQDHCDCRKPQPKFILDAAKEFNVDLAESWMIGDRSTDVLAGKRAGTKTILVQTGPHPTSTATADYTAPTLLEAVEYIAKQG